MTAVLLGGAWAALAWATLSRHRPQPTRVRALAAASRRPRPIPDVLSAVGRLVWRCNRRPFHRPPSPGTERGLGAAALAVAVSLAVAPLLAPVVAGAGWALPALRARAAERRRLGGLEAGLTEIVDLLVLAVSAGCNVTHAVAAAGRRGSGPLAGELRRVSSEAARGRRLADALDELPARAGEATRAMAAVLAGCERYGTPALPALLRLADEVRRQRQRQAEAAARKVPVTLLFPLVLCILPAFALLTVAPTIAGALRELRH